MSLPLLEALRRGAQGVYRVKRYVLALYACNLMLALVLGFVLYGVLRSDLGTSLAGQRMNEGFDSLWYDSFAARATGTAATFGPSVTGYGAIFDALDAFLDGSSGLTFGAPGGGVAPIVALYFLVATFFGAGFLATFVSERSEVSGNEVRSGSFFHGAARYFPRVLFIGLLGLAVYWLIFGPLRSWLDARVSAATRDSIDERVHFAYTSAEYLVLWSLVWLNGLVVGFVKVSTLRQGDVGFVIGVWRGLVEGLRFVLRRPLSCGGLYVALCSLWALLVGLYVAVVPGAEVESGLAVASTFLLGQLFILGRIFLRAMVYASEAVLCETMCREAGAIRMGAATR